MVVGSRLRESAEDAAELPAHGIDDLPGDPAERERLPRPRGVRLHRSESHRVQPTAIAHAVDRRRQRLRDRFWNPGLSKVRHAGVRGQPATVRAPEPGKPNRRDYRETRRRSRPTNALASPKIVSGRVPGSRRSSAPSRFRVCGVPDDAGELAVRSPVARPSPAANSGFNPRSRMSADSAPLAPR